MRRLLQFVGTDYYRAQDPDHWVHELSNYARPILTGGGRLVIPDMRFDNEGSWVSEQGGVEWVIDRPGLSSDPKRQHRSETAYTRTPNFIIKNDGPTGLLPGRVIEGLWAAQTLRLEKAAA
jgi:hypothetical protein